MTVASGCALTPRVVAHGAQPSQPPQTLTNAKGAIVVVNADAGWYGIVPDADRGTRYAPDKLPDELKKDGVRVIFSGRVKAPDPNARRAWGIPLELTGIRRE